MAAPALRAREVTLAVAVRAPARPVIGYWHLQDRWWVSPAEADETGRGASDRHYYRLLTADHQVFEIYRELTGKGLWILDVVQD